MIGKKAQWYMRGSWWRRLRLNRKYKDHLFRFLFRDKKDLLDLYNALNGTDYTQSDELEIVTMEDVIFLKMKNDLSFIIAGKLNLYEHQSSVNSNMPLRGFLYFAQQYEGLVSAGTRSIYGKKRIELPTPEYVVFYNGMDILEDQMELYLSDSYAGGRGSGCLECRCRVLNINRGHNGELVEKCRRLWEYSECVSEVNEWIQKGKAREEAIQLAIDYCIEKDILRDILVKQRAEVLHMLLTEFDEKKFKKTIYTDGYEDGERAGYDKGYSKGEQAGYSKGEQAGYSKGEQAGYGKGEQDMLRRLIRNKQQLGKDAAAIAQELGVEPDVIEKIWESL